MKSAMRGAVRFLACLPLCALPGCGGMTLFGAKSPPGARAVASRPAAPSPERAIRKDIEQLKTKILQLEQETLIISKINTSLMEENARLKLEKAKRKKVGGFPASRSAPHPTIKANVATPKPAVKDSPRPVIEAVEVSPRRAPRPASRPAENLLELSAFDLTLDGIIGKLSLAAPRVPAAARLLEKLQMIRRLEKSGVPLESLTGTDPVAGRLLPQMLEIFKAYKEQDYDTSYELAEKVLGKLEEKASFRISRVEFCPYVNNAIVNYGNFTPVKDRKFSRGQSLFIYCEIKNFGQIKKEESGKSAVSTRINLSILDTAGRSLWSTPIKPVDFVSAAKVRDLYYPIPFTVPATLSSGEFILEVSVEDLAKKMIDVERIRFHVR